MRRLLLAFSLLFAALPAFAGGPEMLLTTMQKPVAGHDSLWSSVATLLNYTGTGSTFVDSSTNVQTITAHGSVTQVGKGVASFNGTTDFLSIPDGTGIQLGGGASDFTVETWFNTNSNSTVQELFGLNGSSISFYAVRILINSTKIVILTSPNNSSWDLNYQTAPTITTGVWNHVALTRSGTLMTIWLNGVNIYNSVPITTLMTGTYNAIGARYSGSAAEYFNGQMAGFRFTKYCRYTATFTPPLPPYSTQ